MKTKIIIMMLFVSISSLMVAQDDDSSDEKKTWWGPKFGLDLSTSTTNLSGITDQLKGNYQAGIFFQFGEKLYLQPELYYSSYKTENGNSSSSINFVKMPLMLGVRILDIGLVSIHAMGGPTYIKQLADYETTGKFRWELGAGVNVLGFITTDLRYTFQNKINTTEIEDLITNGGMVNLTVGLRL